MRVLLLAVASVSGYLLLAAAEALLLFWPAMILLGALHSQPGLQWVPALGWWPTLLVVLLLRCLIPTPDTQKK